MDNQETKTQQVVPLIRHIPIAGRTECEYNRCHCVANAAAHKIVKKEQKKLEREDKYNAITSFILTFLDKKKSCLAFGIVFLLLILIFAFLIVSLLKITGLLKVASFETFQNVTLEAIKIINKAKIV